MVALLKIERIECVPLSMPLPRTFRGSNYFMTHRCTIITRVFTSAGIVGEVYNGDEFETQAEVVRIILDEIQPMLIGKDAFNIEGCWQDMRKPSYNILRDRKLAMCAQACVDSALWDAVGKALQVPLYKLWGGYTDRLPVDLHCRLLRGRQDPRGFRPRDGTDQGGWARRLQVQGGRTNPAGGCRTRARRAAGGGRRFHSDRRCQSGLDAAPGGRILQARRPTSNIRWFEEPVRWYNDRLDMAAARNQTGIPICAGQSEISVAGCRDLMMAGAIDVCNFDASWGGGPTEWRRVAALAAAFTVEMGHHEEPQIAAHLLASVPNGTYLETFHGDRDPMFYRLVANRSPLKDGYYRVPDGPGFGLELDAAAVQKYRV